MYSDEILNRQYDKNKLWGKGLTIKNTLNNYNSIDRTDIEKKIQNKYFDLVIYSSIRRSDLFLESVIKYNNKFLFIDGEDDNYIDERYSNSGLYFKRELVNNRSNVAASMQQQAAAAGPRRRPDERLLTHTQP